MTETLLSAGPLDDEAITRTVEFILLTQEPDGAIPWFTGGYTDPWDHVEAAMALDAAGRHEAARAAYDWLRRVQNPDGSWYSRYQDGVVTDSTKESNFAAYLGVGLWHHLLCTGDTVFLRRMWPTLEAMVDFVLGLQLPGGEVAWAVSPAGTRADEALLTGCCSILHGLRGAQAVAAHLGLARPRWRQAADRLAGALTGHPERFAPRHRFSMDWYYPVLGGALRGDARRRRLTDDWERFVVPGLGARCVADRPWVTAAETSELALALCATGDTATAAELLAGLDKLRYEDGSYWTGYVYPDDAFWPVERTTWTAGAVVLAAAAVVGAPATSRVFATPED
ncbi:prenyltransferase [Amorphoplanes nipponensis]|uniref:Prenyltransferase n=1 Tax=Actinoplanes nipponensis TaxID=135950 RepID=A0A919JK80_9ACTN|nr:prenyltransferase/squalene oxidase repeat-containing protein [Actinoplanes nipponensis]GIE50957.1 prenyltransferase [Actinoplanes nipponensis]